MEHDQHNINENYTSILSFIEILVINSIFLCKANVTAQKLCKQQIANFWAI